MTLLTALILALVLSAYYSGMETAYTAFDRILTVGWLRARRWGAQSVHFLSRHPDRFLSTVLIGTNIANVAFSSLVVVLTASIGMHEIWSVIATPFVVLILGELLPKVMGYSLSNLAVRWLSFPLLISYYLFFPFRIILAPLMSPFSRRHEERESKRGNILLQRSDLDHILLGAEAEGAVSPEESELLTRYLDARELKVRQIMTPRMQLEAVSVELTPDEVLEVFRHTRYNILPVYEGDLDHIIGYVSARQFLEPCESVRSILRPLHAVPESKKIVDLLQEFKTERRQYALVIDEHGGTDGLVTLKDIMEELIGSVAERLDPDEPVIKRIAPGKFLVSGSADIYDVAEATGWEPPETEANTVSGLLAEHLGKIADVGEDVNINNVVFRVIRRTPRRVEGCLLKLPPELIPDNPDRS
ncbi:MAG: hemolysin family protein [Calditrichota bacterium]